MTPAFRRNGILAGLALSALCALGFTQQSSREWALRWQAEAEARESREAELDAAQRERAAEMEAMQRRVALLESELAQERVQREGAEARAAEAGKPAEEVEATKAELARAYARIGELERGDVEVARLGRSGVILRTVRAAAQNGTVEVPTVVYAGGSDGRDVEFKLQEADVYDKVISLEVAEEKAQEAIIGTMLIEGKVLEPLPQKFEGGLNQGVDYVEPAMAPEAGERLNQGTSYIDPSTVQEKLQAIRKLIVDLKQVQQEQR